MKALLLVISFLVSIAVTWAAEKPKPRYGFYFADEPMAAEDSAPDGELSLRAFPELPTPILPVVISNRTEETAKMLGCDRFLYIVEEARDAEGQWRPIERYPESGCGNSFFYVQLGSGQAWTLIGVRHSGSFKTRLRFKLDGKTPIYSNEFDGSIDPSQFNVPKSGMPSLQEILKVLEEEEQCLKRNRP